MPESCIRIYWQESNSEDYNMPLHLDSIVPDNRHDAIAMEILRRSSDADPLFVSEDKMIIHSAVEIIDSF